MSEIYVSHTGNGVAYVDNPYPFPGDYFTLYAIPTAPDTLENISVRDAQGMYIAVDPHLEEQTLRYREEYGEYITIEVEFSNIGPGPEPPGPPPADPGIIIILKQKDNYFIPNLR